jgi:hypothetical protein
MPTRLLIFAGLLMFFLALQGFTQTNDSESDTTLTADVLIATLYAKTISEKEYCENIIRLRDEKKLPSRIFYGVYRKSINLEKNRRFSYFQTGLEILCKREGIILEQPVSFKPPNVFSATPTKPSATVSKNSPTSAGKQNPFSFIPKLYRSWFSSR